jgi:hypothetical protein
MIGVRDKIQPGAKLTFPEALQMVPDPKTVMQ